MNAQERIAKLESLLDRIRRNVSKPRGARAEAPSAAAPAPAAAPVPAAPVVAQMAAPAPAAVAPAPPPAPVPPPPEPVREAAPPDSLDAPDLEIEITTGPADIEDLDMMDVEIVEIAVESSIPESEPRAPMQTLADEPPDTVDEMVPESAPRPAAATATAADADDAELEAPLKTPPPESGRQAVATSSYDDSAREADLSSGDDVDSLLEADLSGAPISRAPAAGGPTMEQLGETVELEGADAPAANLELDQPESRAASESTPDELELDLPKQRFSGGYDAPAPPPEPPRHVPEPAPVAAAGPAVVARPPVDAIAAEVVTAAPQKLPETFLELLDASLSLKA